MTTKRFDFIRDHSLPKSAWCLKTHARSELVQVRHGDNVEVLGDSFFSGAWAGSFTDRGFVDAATRVGTGAALRDDELVLVAASHPYAGVFVTRKRDGLLASNSMLFLLAETDATPIWRDLTYFNVLSRQNRYPSADHDFNFSGARIRSMRLDRFVIDADLAIHREETRTGARFSDFASFRGRVTEILASVAENASSAERTRPLKLTATISAGYDSSGSAALGYDAGWRDAVTIVREGTGASDDGTAIAERLGYRVEACASDAWMHTGPCPEAEFLAGCGPVTRVRFAGAPALSQSVMLTGTMGDMSWAPGTPLLKERYNRPFDYPGTEDGLNEWALRVGTAFLPVPSIGADDREQFHRLNDAPEMAPWKLGTEYDRPLARRLVEERGVPREAFGQRKMASAQLASPEHLADASRADFNAWMHDHATPGRELFYQATRIPSGLVLRATHRLARPTLAHDLRMWRLVAHPPWATGHLFHWAVERTRPRYGSPQLD